MNIYKFVTTLSTADIAGILTACGYAIREEISLFKALEQMDFEIDTDEIPDVCSDEDLIYLALFCTCQLIPRPSNPFNRG